MDNSEAGNKATIKVMVVNANLKSQRQLQRVMMKNEGIEVVGTHKRGRSALNALRNEEIDLVFLNPDLSDLNGFDLISYLSPAPLIVMVSDRYDYGYFAFKIGAIDFINTDFSDAEFRACLERVMTEVDRRRVYKAYLAEKETDSSEEG